MSRVMGRDAIRFPLRFRRPVRGCERKSVVRTGVDGVHLEIQPFMFRTLNEGAKSFIIIALLDTAEEQYEYA